MTDYTKLKELALSTKPLVDGSMLAVHNFHSAATPDVVLELIADLERKSDALQRLWAERDELCAQVDELSRTLNDMYVAAPTAVECQHFHHRKNELHNALDECKPAKNYLSALAAAKSAIDTLKAGK